MKINLQKPVFFLFMCISLWGCTKINETIVDVKEMKTELTEINNSLGLMPIGKMDVFAKDDSSSVSYFYKVTDKQKFINSLTVSASKVGFTMIDKRAIQNKDESQLLQLCSEKVEYRLLYAELMSDNSIVVGIHANKVKPIFGENVCSKSNITPNISLNKNG